MFQYLIIINIVAFLLFGEDKRRARQGKWRISEKTLFLSAIAGGSYGAFAGMRYFHHKTRHLKFSIGIPAICILQAGVLYWLFY